MELQADRGKGENASPQARRRPFEMYIEHQMSYRPNVRPQSLRQARRGLLVLRAKRVQ